VLKDIGHVAHAAERLERVDHHGGDFGGDGVAAFGRRRGGHGVADGDGLLRGHVVAVTQVQGDGLQGADLDGVRAALGGARARLVAGVVEEGVGLGGAELLFALDRGAASSISAHEAVVLRLLLGVHFCVALLGEHVLGLFRRGLRSSRAVLGSSFLTFQRKRARPAPTVCSARSARQ
jgi:hypothetical protein